MTENPQAALAPQGSARGSVAAAPAAHGPSAAAARRPVGLVMAGLWFALLVGWIDVLIVAVQKFAFGSFIHRSAHIVWMAPAAYVAMFVPAATMLALLSRRWPRLVSHRTAIFLLAFAAALTILLILLYQRIHEAALLALAAGVAIQVSRTIASRGAAFSRLVRRTTPVAALAALVLGGAIAVRQAVAERSAIAGLPGARAGAPNVLLLILDTVRAPSLGLHGYERPTTPRLEQFAQRGVVFENAMAPSSWTLPSHASMFTGREPQELSTGWLSPLDESDPTVAEVLSDHGYTTAAFVANLRYATRETGLDRGFIRYSDYRVTPGQIFLHSGLGRFLSGRRALRTLIGTDEVVARADADDINRAFLEWSEGIEDRPFFAFLNYYDAHDPYLPPNEFFRKLTGRDRPHRLSPMRRSTVRERANGMRPEDLRLEIDSYDAAIAYLDDSVGRLLDELERRGTLDNTIVVIASDHGEEFGEHGIYWHGSTLYLPSLHVPLIIAYPGGPAGVRVAEPVGLVDIAATIAELAAIDGTGGLGGRSLAPYWRTPDAPGRPLRAELQKGIRLPEWYPVSIGDMSSMIADGLHYIRNGDGREELYDLERDPREQNDLAGSAAAADRLPRFRSLLAGPPDAVDRP